MNLGGWVRNQPDGSVEVWAEGTEMALTRLQGLLEKGPDMAHVRSVDVMRDLSPMSEGNRFDIV